MAGNGTLDIDRLGRDIVELTRLDALKPKRITDTLRAASTTAPVTVHALLAAVIPSHLPQQGHAPRAGLTDLLGLAADSADAAPGRPPRRRNPRTRPAALRIPPRQDRRPAPGRHHGIGRLRRMSGP
ncbi:hypothetical protein [Streptomyces sp. NPDC051014]|uniref:hypothetical protein n=1 Tax=Streptomyces sp. NPDC051014 TaxID=3155751 RepID=UPI0033C1C353